MPKRKPPKSSAKKTSDLIQSNQPKFIYDYISGEKFTPDEWEKIENYRKKLIKQRKSDIEDVSVSSSKTKIREKSQQQRNKTSQRFSKPKSEEQKEKISKSTKGIKHSQQTREKQSKSQKIRRLKEKNDFSQQMIENFGMMLDEKNIPSSTKSQINAVINSIIESDGLQNTALMLNEFQNSPMFPKIVRDLYYVGESDTNGIVSLFVSSMLAYLKSNNYSDDEIKDLMDEYSDEFITNYAYNEFEDEEF